MMSDLKLGLNWTATPPSPHLTGALADRRLEIPTTVDWLAEAATVGVTITNGNPRCNDLLRCCVVAGAYQAIRIMRAVAGGDTQDFTDQQVIDTYGLWAGYAGTDETDTGTDSRVAGILWGSKGLRWGQQLEDVPNVVPLALPSLRPAVAFLGPVQLDLSIPERWVSDIDTWDVAANDVPAGGHRVCAVGYTPLGLWVVSWGLRKFLTNAALAMYGLGAWACVSRSWLDATGMAPSALDYAALDAEGRTLAA